MPRNKVQFQKGLSFIEFCQRYGTEEQCHAELVAMRWPRDGSTISDGAMSGISA
jgi:hypothetical protein